MKTCMRSHAVSLVLNIRLTSLTAPILNRNSLNRRSPASEDKSPPSKLILIWLLLSKLTVFKILIFLKLSPLAVVPSYYLVWYNQHSPAPSSSSAVVPSYYLVWYNYFATFLASGVAVVPSYYLVWYNKL